MKEFGYRFLRVPNGNRHGEAEKIEECDLIGLRKYMCPITHGDTDHCLNKCQGLRTCRVGQKAAALLDEKAKMLAGIGPDTQIRLPDELSANGKAEAATGAKTGPDSGKKRVWSEESRKKIANTRIENARKKVMEAIASGDPVGWLKQRGLSAKQATTDLSRWRIKYPDLFEGVELPKRSPKSKGKTKQDYERDNLAQYREAVLNHQPKPYIWLAEVRGIGLRSAMNQMLLWKKKYGPVVPDAEPAPEPEAPTEEQPEQEETEMASGEDMVSLDEFLSQYLPKEEAKEPEPEPEPEKAPEPEKDPSWVNPNGRLAALMKEEAGLLEEIARMQDRIWRIRAERRGIERMMSH